MTRTGGGSHRSTGYDGSILPHHDGLKWLHSVANWTVRSGPVKSGSEKEEQIRSGARSRRHSRRADRGGADSSRPCGASAGPAQAVIASSHRSTPPAARPAGRQHAGPEIGSHSVTGAGGPSAQVSAVLAASPSQPTYRPSRARTAVLFSPACANTHRQTTRAVKAAGAHGGVRRAAWKVMAGVSDNGPLSRSRIRGKYTASAAPSVTLPYAVNTGEPSAPGCGSAG